MNQPPTMPLRQQRNFSDTLQAAFTYLRENFSSFARGLLFIAGPFVLFSAALSAFGQYTIWRSGTFDVARTSSTMVLSSVVGVLAGTVLIAVALEHLRLHEKAGQVPNVSELWNAVRSRILPLVGVSILTGVIVVFGTLMLLLPGIYAAVALAIAAPVLVFEGVGPLAAVKRSFQLVRHRWWATFGLLLITAIVVGLMTVVFAIPQSIISSLISIHEGPSDYALLGALFSAFSTFCSTLLASVFYLVIAFHYFSLAEEKEATGLMERIGQLDATEGTRTA